MDFPWRWNPPDIPWMPGRRHHATGTSPVPSAEHVEGPGDGHPGGRVPRHAVLPAVLITSGDRCGAWIEAGKKGNINSIHGILWDFMGFHGILGKSSPE